MSPCPPVPRFIKYTGYGNAAGLLAARGLMAGGRPEGQYSEDEDTDTDEYKEAKARCVGLSLCCPRWDGGWVGQDEDTFQPRLSASQVSWEPVLQLRSPWPSTTLPSPTLC